MAHELTPRSGALPPPREVARLLEAFFPFVHIDPEEGLRYARAVAERFERSTAPLLLGRKAEVTAYVARLRSLELGEALSIEFGDRAERTMAFVLLPGDSIKFGYRSTEDEQESRDLVERCARALDCEVRVI